MAAIVTSVGLSERHVFSKAPRQSIRLLSGLGVEGDAHMGATVQHIYARKKNATLPNLCQVHLIHAELFDELSAKGFTIQAGDLGENITTQGLDLLGLPTGTRLTFGACAVVEVTGVRTPCVQINKFQKGLMAATMDKDAQGKLIRKAGIMGIVVADGTVRAGDKIDIELPPLPHLPLQPV